MGEDEDVVWGDNGWMVPPGPARGPLSETLTRLRKMVEIADYSAPGGKAQWKVDLAALLADHDRQTAKIESLEALLSDAAEQIRDLDPEAELPAVATEAEMTQLQALWAVEPLGDKWGWCIECDAPWDPAHRFQSCRRIPLYLRKADL